MAGKTWKEEIPCPSESTEQICLFRWAAAERHRYPELALLFHIPNGGKRGKAEASIFKAEGVKAGIPDLCLPVARGGYHGLYIELKRQRGGKVSPEQKEIIRQLTGQGYMAEVCRGWEEAADLIADYLEGTCKKNLHAGNGAAGGIWAPETVTPETVALNCTEIPNG